MSSAADTGAFRPSRWVQFTPKQREAWQYVGKGGVLFFGGARAGGKSGFCLRAAWLVACQMRGIRVVLVRKTYPELEDVFITKFLDTFPSSHGGKELHRYKQKEKTATFWNRSRIIFRAVETEADAEKLQGVECDLLVIDEAPNMEERIFQRLQGSVRGRAGSGFIPTTIMTGNPGGISDHYFITHFVEPDYSQWTESELAQKDHYHYIHARVEHNPHVDRDYVRRLEALPDDLRKAWLHGIWGNFAGQFFASWRTARHVIEPFDIPEHWPRLRCVDLGYSTHPTVCLWLAQDPEDQRIYVYREYADAGPLEHHVMQISALQPPDEDAQLGYGDPAMFAEGKKERYDSESPARIFLRNGIALLPANNDRSLGWLVVKQWLESPPDGGPPMLQVFACCTVLIETFPLQRYSGGRGGQKTKDLDTRGRDDAVDALRYGLVSGFGYPPHVASDEPPQQEQEPATSATPRDELAARWDQPIPPSANFG